MTSSTKPGEHSADEEPSVVEALAGELNRLAEGFRRLPHSKFGLRLEPYGDRARAGHWIAAQVSMVAQGMESWDSPQPPVWRELPTVGVFALGDQIAVVGNDLVAAYRALNDPRETFIWTPGDGRVPAEKAMAAVLDSTTALRRAL
jgi:hypothetical protein